MTPNRDHATLFVAPPASSDSRSRGRPESGVDGSAAAMRRLRHPFTIPAELTAATTEPTA
jgi:hypothetical protein